MRLRFLLLVVFALVPVLIPSAVQAVTQESKQRRHLPLRVLEAKLSDSHSVSLSVGTPAKAVQLIIDTGSHHTAFPCDADPRTSSGEEGYSLLSSATASYHSCRDCPEETVCEGGRCRHSQSYSEGSTWSSSSFMDVVYLPDRHTSSLFCIEEQTGLFLRQVEDGILGLSRNSDFLNSLGSPSFSLCFTPDAGYMSFGEDDLAQGPLPVSIRPTGYYTLPVSRVHLGSVELQCLAYFNRGKGTVLDSGTTDTYLPADCARSFKTAWRAATGKDFSNTVQNIEHADFEKLPVLSFSLEGGQAFDIHPSSYMEPGKRLGEYVCRLYIDEKYGAIIGANGLAYKRVWFGSEQVAFEDSACQD